MQTTIQNSAAVRKGSVQAFIGDSVAALVDIGAIRNPKLTSLAEDQTIKFDNAPDLKLFANGDKVQFSFDLTEINLTNLAKFDGGLVTLSTVAGSPTAITGEAHGTGWTQGKPIALTNKNGDNTIVSSIVVKGGGSTLVLNTDYRTYVGDGSNGPLGVTYINPITAQAGAITVDYSYTPNASKKLVFNNAGSKLLKAFRAVNTDSNGKKFQIDIQNCTNVAAPAISFAADADAEVATLPVTIEGYFNATAGITDEQQTA
jgi:hypothetical protein